MVVGGFNVDVFDSGAWDVTVEIVEVSIFFEIEARDVAVYETVTVREMAVEFIDIVHDRVEVPVDTSAVTEPVQAGVELGQRGHLVVSYVFFDKLFVRRITVDVCRSRGQGC
jgi:hypothetical protein